MAKSVAPRTSLSVDLKLNLLRFLKVPWSEATHPSHYGPLEVMAVQTLVRVVVTMERMMVTEVTMETIVTLPLLAVCDTASPEGP